MIIWLDGTLQPLENARISPLDHGFLVGDGVFETLRVYDGAPFAWRRHADRLRASAEGLGLAVPDCDRLRLVVDDVLAANGLRDARLRITVTSGVAPPGSSRRGSRGTTVVLVAVPIEPPAATADVVIAPWTRNEHGALAGLKTISYAANARALTYAESRRAVEAIFANTQGNLCEATGSNVFCVLDGVLVTPPATAGCLLGVTRALVLELCAALDVAAAERDVPVGALHHASEAFLSSTTRGVQPIAHVDGLALPAVPGPVSVTLAHALGDLIARDIDP